MCGTVYVVYYFVPLCAAQARENLGTVLLSLSYNPESKKLSVIILRAKDLNKSVAKDIGKYPCQVD